MLLFLASSVSVDFFAPSDRSRQHAAKSQIFAFMDALNRYGADVGQFPREA
ncbi:MAG TPA: hypothetical protein VHW09_04960 [Bryobacteraceae bacterium]|nr:hypothetical protein [Bryobacteraceae bacterium]